MLIAPLLLVLATSVQGQGIASNSQTQPPVEASEVAAPIEPPLEEVKPKEAKKFDAIAIPLLSFNSDQGFGYGGVGGAYFYAPGYKPYRHAIAVNVFFTSLGIQNHWIRYDGPKLIGNNRLEVRLDYRRELLAPWYGLGNISSPEFAGDVTDKKYNFERTSPGAWVRLRGRPFGDTHPFQPYAGYGYRHTRVTTYDNSLLALNPQRGMEGGSTGQVMAGALWDTRDDESDPTRGGVEEISFRGSARGTASDYTFGGVTFIEKRFIQLGSPRLVFGQRFTVDALFGDVPFFEWANVGGIATTEGIGGISSVRGIPRNRYSGGVKAFSNSELRFYAFNFPLFGEPVRVGGIGLVDFGRVWHPDTEDGNWNSWHPGVGAGVRIARKAAVLRVDWGYAPEINRNGFYVAFGHMF